MNADLQLSCWQARNVHCCRILKALLCLFGSRIRQPYRSTASCIAIVGILATFRFWKSRLLSIFGIREDSNEEDDEDIPIEN